MRVCVFTYNVVEDEGWERRHDGELKGVRPIWAGLGLVAHARHRSAGEGLGVRHCEARPLDLRQFRRHEQR